MWKKFMHLFKVKTDSEYIEAYLAESVSLADLERRQKELRSKGYIA